MAVAAQSTHVSTLAQSGLNPQCTQRGTSLSQNLLACRKSPEFTSPILRASSCSRRVSCNVSQRTMPELYEGIANFYNESSGVWEDIWGEHMHHGYYDNEAGLSENDHKSAQIRMIENSLAFAGVPGKVFLLHVGSF